MCICDLLPVRDSTVLTVDMILLSIENLCVIYDLHSPIHIKMYNHLLVQRSPSVPSVLPPNLVYTSLTVTLLFAMDVTCYDFPSSIFHFAFKINIRVIYTYYLL